MGRFNVEYKGKYAAFSTTTDAFITPLWDKETYAKWYKEEYQKEFSPNKNVRDIEEAISNIFLNRNNEDALNTFLECGLEREECEKIFYEVLRKYKSPIDIRHGYYKCPNCGTIVRRDVKICPDKSCCLDFFWEED